MSLGQSCADPKTQREQQGMKLFGASTGRLSRFDNRALILAAKHAEKNRLSGRRGTPPPIELVDYPDLFERAWGWDFLLPNDMVTPLAVYKLYLRQYYNRNHHNAAAAADDDHGNGLLAALVDKCIKTEDKLKHTWSNRAASFTTDVDDDEKEIPSVSNEITKHAREMAQVRGSESPAAIALECIIKEAELMCQCILSGDSVVSFAVSNAVRRCALTFMISKDYDYVSVAAAMMGIMKETELVIGFLREDQDKNNAKIGHADIFRHRTMLIMLELCHECYVVAEPTVGNITGDLNSNESDDELVDNGNHEEGGSVSENKDEYDEKNSKEKLPQNGMDGGNRTNGNQDDEITCPFICSEVGLMALEAKEQRLQIEKDAACVCYANFREELQMLKQTLETLDSVVSAIWKMKMRPVEPMPVVKPVVEKKNMQIFLDSSLLALVFVGILIGVVVAGIWK